MNLLYSNCVPCLTYAAEVKELPSSKMQPSNVALNDSIRRIFSYNRWESTRVFYPYLSVSSTFRIFYFPYLLLSTVRKPNDLVLMNLLYSNCVPCLTYAAEVKELPSSEMQSSNVALNDSIRRIFSYNRWESTRTLRQQLGFLNITEIFQSRRDTFVSQCLKLWSNKVIFSLASFLYSPD